MHGLLSRGQLYVYYIQMADLARVGIAEARVALWRANSEGTDSVPFHVFWNGTESVPYRTSRRAALIGYTLPFPKHDNLCMPAETIYREYRDATRFGNIFSLDVGPNYEGKLRRIDVETLHKVGEMIMNPR